MKKSFNTSSLLASALGAVLLAPALAQADPAAVPGYKFDKCYGVNAAGKNDCAVAGLHGCAGQGTRAQDPKSWIYVPSGTCARIQGGSTTPKSA
jgi:uncharacterized membrane protein